MRPALTLDRPLLALASIAPAQVGPAWVGARLAQRLAAADLSRVMAAALLTTGIVMPHSSMAGR